MTANSFELLPRTRAQFYTVEDQLRRARDPEMEYVAEEPRTGEEDTKAVLGEEEVALTTQAPQGWTLVLNVVEGMHRIGVQDIGMHYHTLSACIFLAPYLDLAAKFRKS